LRKHLRAISVRHQPPGQVSAHIKSGIGAALGLCLVTWLAAETGLSLLIAPLGATVVLLFGHAESPLAQPINIFAGYLLATVFGVAAAHLFPETWPASALAVGLSIATMLALRVTHPPAGAVPLVAMGTANGGVELFATIFIACLSLVAVAWLHHRLPPRVVYPVPPAATDDTR